MERTGHGHLTSDSEMHSRCLVTYTHNPGEGGGHVIQGHMGLQLEWSGQPGEGGGDRVW